MTLIQIDIYSIRSFLAQQDIDCPPTTRRQVQTLYFKIFLIGLVIKLDKEIFTLLQFDLLFLYILFNLIHMI